MRGFTLIELLVVISIMAIIGTFTIANFRSFGEDKELENAALDIQSQIRTAQTNALTGVKCNTTTSAKEWRVIFSNNRIIDIKCFDGNGEYPFVKTLSLSNNIEISSIDSLRQIGIVPACSYPANVRFLTLSGTFSADCDPGQDIQITLKNTKTNSTKQVIIDKGGRVYVQ